MTQPVHDNELDTSADLVRRLLASDLPELASLDLTPLANSGTTNALWRLHRPGLADLLVRLPRQQSAIGSIDLETDLLGRLGDSPLADLVATPQVVHVGGAAPSRPSDSAERAHRWLVTEWLDGADAWVERGAIAHPPVQLRLADQLAEVVSVIASLDLPAPPRERGDRGGPIAPVLDRLDWWLTAPRWNAVAHVDVAAIRAHAAAASERVLAAEPSNAFVHGDLIPGNLLMRDGRLAAILDWGSAGVGDPAQDLAPAWSVFEPPARDRFLTRIASIHPSLASAHPNLDDATVARAKLNELEHAVGAILYYRPRGHELADVMAATLDRLLAD